MPLVELPNGTVPAADESVDLPLFDVSQETPELGRQIVEAAARWGFLWIVAAPASDGDSAAKSGDYFLDEQTVDNAFDISKRFFKEAPASEKQQCAIKHNRGYVGMHVENLDPEKHTRGDFKQAFNLAEPDHTTGHWRQPLPSEFQKEDATLRDFHARCRGLATRILRLIALGLSISDVDWLARTHEGSPNTARFLYYPALPPDTDYNPEADIGAGAHSDYGSITLLFTRPGQPGLEILRPDHQTWASVPVFPPNYHSDSLPPIVVNIGDLLSYWTNGLLRSTVHRVVLTTPAASDKDHQGALSNGFSNTETEVGAGSDRFSIAIFIQPEDSTKLVSIPSPLVEAEASSFAKKVVGHGGGVVEAEGMGTLTAGDYLSGRLQATYGKVYEREK
ncbi:putative oxidoreductase protein [Phaeoacremonium minimum UCRPA7]|uniref:Putative oxidoreductase protein n=1 Tax=Phaeoacremonium minimum (strain UCR-PA7) TaxID=1286976 RepID=R8BP44_PHAM7|nr:putative oxidoreductase protein [Phaeoacremonium minimum UCRPA7]EOO01060.1 putative oxidoreductase protein [Phaeoacremonium minimum UCRPA7]